MKKLSFTATTFLDLPIILEIFFINSKIGINIPTPKISSAVEIKDNKIIREDWSHSKRYRRNPRPNMSTLNNDAYCAFCDDYGFNEYITRLQSKLGPLYGKNITTYLKIKDNPKKYSAFAIPPYKAGKLSSLVKRFKHKNDCRICPQKRDI